MRAVLAIALVLLAAGGAGADDRVWGSGVVRYGGRAVVTRYLDQLPAGLQPGSQPERVTIRWPYEGAGMPSEIEQVRMDRLGDQLAPAVERDGLATLVAVSIGNGRCEWLYYTRASREFVARLNALLRDQPRPPIQIDLARDPQWKTYHGVREEAAR